MAVVRPHTPAPSTVIFAIETLLLAQTRSASPGISRRCRVSNAAISCSSPIIALTSCGRAMKQDVRYACDDQPKQRPRQVTFGELQGEVWGMPDQASARLAEPLLETRTPTAFAPRGPGFRSCRYRGLPAARASAPQGAERVPCSGESSRGNFCSSGRTSVSNLWSVEVSAALVSRLSCDASI